jgi:RimJ/RimL family protein N-acetyltransferase
MTAGRRERPGTIRKLMPGERDAFAAHLLRLDPASRRARFAAAVSDAFVIGYARRALHAASVLHGWFLDGTLRAAAELHPYGTAAPELAEAAFSVEQPHQNSGIGTELMARTILAARNRRIRLLHVRCVVDNRRMRAIARRYGAELRLEHGDAVGELSNPAPTPISLARELMADGHGLIGAVLDVQARLLRTT